MRSRHRAKMFGQSGIISFDAFLQSMVEFFGGRIMRIKA